jgi:hypothetical protein
MPSGFPDYTCPIIWVAQEGQLWPITDWVAKQGQKKSWHVVGTVGAMGTVITTLYTVPAGKKLYVPSAVFSNDVNMRHQLYYTPAALYITDFYQGPYRADQHMYQPPEAISAGETFYYAAMNLTGGVGGFLAMILAYEIDV